MSTPTYRYSSSESDSHLERFVELYPDAVGEILGEGLTTFERWKKENKERGQTQWYPFANKKEWELAAWLAQNVGHNKIDGFLKLAMVSCQFGPFACRLLNTNADQRFRAHDDKQIQVLPED